MSSDVSARHIEMLPKPLFRAACNGLGRLGVEASRARLSRRPVCALGEHPAHSDYSRVPDAQGRRAASHQERNGDELRAPRNDGDGGHPP